jgi:hypothetical protein
MRCRVRSFAFCALVLALAVGCGKKAEPADEPVSGPGSNAPSDRDRAQGVWKVTKLEWPKGGVGWLDGVKSATVTIEGDCVTVATTVPAEGHPYSGDNEFYFAFADEMKAGRVNLVTTEGKGIRKPRTETVFTATKDGERVPKEVPFPPRRAIYKFEGETLVVACPAESGADRPTVFEPGRVNVPEGLGNESVVLVVHLKKK